jgi:hypothetical protein
MTDDHTLQDNNHVIEIASDVAHQAMDWKPKTVQTSIDIASTGNESGHAIRMHLSLSRNSHQDNVHRSSLCSAHMRK